MDVEVSDANPDESTKIEVESDTEGDTSGSDDPVFIKKLKGELTERKKLTLSPVKLTRFKKAMTFTDIRLDFIIFLRDFLIQLRNQPKDASPINEATMKDVLTLIGIISSKGNFEANKFYRKSNKHPASDEIPTEESYTEFKKYFTELWGEIMKWKMTPSIHRSVVILLPEKVMMHLTKPLHMSDFLLESFKLGGPVSLVSLHGIFLLMQNFNFEVADFYTRLYSMFVSDTLTSKYRARFFAYSREFLSSTHLPESLVASFIKKLARLSLGAPAPALPMIFDFITNLILQHPGLKIMLNPLRSDGKPKINPLIVPDYWHANFDSLEKADVSAELNEPDPFNEDELDPMKTLAIESWLCEIKILQNHSISSIALAAKFISKSLPKVEKDLDETLSLTYKDIEAQERQLSENLEAIPSHVKPVSDWDPINHFAAKKAKIES